MEIYISSVAFLGLEPEDFIGMAKDQNWAIEFSSGMHYREDMEEIFLSSGITRMAHNYFPAAKVPFVLNLASSDATIRRNSIEHCLRMLELSKQVEAPFFAAHAGFCIDPNPLELGRKINFNPEFDRNQHKLLFIEAINIILQMAEELEIDFLIENNVIAPFNLIADNVNPFLCCTFEEMEWMIKTVDHRRLGILLDTGHLKVSCKTLGLDIVAEMDKILPLIRGLHHSDNDGLSDSNEKLDEDYWFIPFIEKSKEQVHVIEVKQIDNATISEQINILKKYGR